MQLHSVNLIQEGKTLIPAMHSPCVPNVLVSQLFPCPNKLFKFLCFICTNPYLQNSILQILTSLMIWEVPSAKLRIYRGRLYLSKDLNNFPSRISQEMRKERGWKMFN